MTKRNRKLSVFQVKLSQEAAATILGCSRESVGRQERGEGNRGPITGAIEYLIATWGRFSPEEQQEILLDLAVKRQTPIEDTTP